MHPEPLPPPLPGEVRPKPAEPVVPECPRCGYDQSGVMQAWKNTQCPVHGTCSECGLEFLWRDLLNPAYSRHTELFEHTRTRLARKFLRTFLLNFNPFRIWSQIEMHHRVRPKRIAVFVLGSLALWYIAVSLSAFAAYGLTYLLEFNQPWPTFHSFGVVSTEAFIWPHLAHRTIWYDFDIWIVASAQFLIALISLAMFACFVLLPQTRNRYRVRWRHLFRIAAYSLCIFPVFWSVWVVLYCLESVLIGMVMHIDNTSSLFWITTLFGLIWVMLYWGAACHCYLKIPNPYFVSFLLTVRATIISGTIWAIVASLVLGQWHVIELILFTV